MGNDAFSDLLHDIAGTCRILKDAASMLNGGTSKDELETLDLMSSKARKLADSLVAYTAAQRAQIRE